RGNRTRGGHRTSVRSPRRPRARDGSAGQHAPRCRAVRRPDRGIEVTASAQDRVLSIVVCGAGPAVEIATFVKLAIDRGWDVQVIATTPALAFFDQAAI